MVRTRGGHNFRPRVRASSPPSAAGQSSPPATPPVVSPAPVPTAPAPRRYDTWVGPTPPSLTHSRLSQRAPPPKRARSSDPSKSSSSRPQEPPHLFKVQLMTYPQICPLLLLSDAPSSIVAPLQAIQISVPRKCTARHIMIFQLLLPISSSEIP